MKVFLTHLYFLEEDKAELKIMRPYPPLGLLYISSFAKKNSINTKIIDNTFSNKNEFWELVKTEKPDVIGVYLNFKAKINFLEFAKKIKQDNSLSNIKLIIGGPDVRYNYNEYLSQGADIAVIGEGEDIFVQIINSDFNLENIPNIAYQSNEGIKVNSINSEDLLDIEILPLPARSEIDIQKYLDTWKNKHGYSSISISTMRGCPFSCKWCSKAVYGRSHRRRSAGSVIEEIIKLKKVYTFDYFWFVDDVFTINKKWLSDFNSELKKNEISIAYECITRADKIDAETADLLAATGCKKIWIGAESGSQKILDAMSRGVKVEEVIKAIKLCKERNIFTGTFIMFGYPGETLRDIEKTIKYLKKAKPDQVLTTDTYPIKGTELYELVENDLEKFDWSKTPDNNLVYKKRYSSKFYKHANARLQCEMKVKNNQIKLAYKILFKAKSVYHKLNMFSETI